MPEPTQLPTLPLLLAGAVGGALSAGALLAYSVFMPRCQFWAPVMTALPQRDAVALTFDDGPHSDFTPAILDILARHHVTATFFIIGRFAREHPDLIRRIHAAGHTLGNHSLDHEHFGINRNRAYWDRQLTQTQQIIAEIIGQPPVLFRPPMGFKTRHIAAAARALHLPIVGWSVRALDTRATGPEALTRRVLNRLTGRDIVLLHDGVEPARRAGSQQCTVDALPAILDGIAARRLRALSLREAILLPRG